MKDSQSNKGRVDCHFKDVSEVPIRTYHNGVLWLAMAVFAGIVSLIPADKAAASQTLATRKVVKTSTTKGVRTRAYQTRQSVVKKAKAASYTAASIPSEGAADSSGMEIADRAKALVGSRYKWGGTSRQTGFDCSGLVHNVYGDKADALPRSAADMYNSVSKTSDLKPGDLVFFGRGTVHHAAVYIGNGEIVHASTPRTGVRVDSLAIIAQALGFKGVGRI